MAEVFADRIAAVAGFDGSAYERAAARGALTGEAALVVLAVAAAHTLAAWPVLGVADALMTGVQWSVGWVVGVTAVWAGLHALGPPCAFDALFRAGAYASLPFALALFGRIAFIGPLFTLAAWGLGIAAIALAIQRVSGRDALPAWALCLASVVVARGLAALLF